MYPRLVGGIHVAHLFSFLCCVFMFVCLRPVSCVPNLASISILSILDCPFGLLTVYNNTRDEGDFSNICGHLLNTMSMNDLLLYHIITNRIGGVMHTVIVIDSSSAVDIGFDPRWRKNKDNSMVFVLLLRYAGSIKEKEQNLVDSESIRIICPSGTACISEDCCFSELAL